MYKTIADLIVRAKRTGKQVTVNEIYDAHKDFDHVYVDSILASLEQKSSIYVDQESQTIVMI